MRYLSDIIAKAGLVVDGVVTLNNVANATIDTDKFLVIDSGVVKYRSGTQMLSDIGAAAVAAGTTNYVTKWVSDTALGNSQIFDNGTNVGIGTASPSVKLHVAQSGGDIAVFSRGDTGNALVQYTSFGTTSDIIHRLRLNNGSGNFFDVRYYAVNNYLGLDYGGTTRLAVSNSGNVGIGTTSPGVRLDVKGSSPTISVGESGAANGLSFSWDNSNGFANINTTGSAWPIRFMQNDTERLRIFANGRVFVGASPSDAGYLFDVNGTARINSDLRINSTAGFNTLFTQAIGGGGLGMVSTTDPIAADQRLYSLGFGSINYPAQARIEALATEIWSSTNRGSSLRFNTTANGATGSSVRMFIGNDGFVGINTSSPLARLHVAGNMRSDNDAFFATSSGRVGIGTATPGYKVDTIVGTNGFDGYNVYGAQGGVNEVIGYRSTQGNGIGLIMGTTGAQATSALGGPNQSVIYSVGNQNLIFGTNSTSRMVLSPDGNLGLGMTPVAMSNYGVFNLKGRVANQAGLIAFYDGNGDNFGGIQSDTNYGLLLANGQGKPIVIMTNSVARLSVNNTGGVTVSSLAGTGVRLVTADANGLLGVSGLASGVVTGSGTLNYLPKWTPDGATLGNSQIFDNGGGVGIGTTSPGQKLEIYDGALLINRPSLANDASHTMFRTQVGTDATLGQFYFMLTARPSATGPNRYVEMFAGDNVGYRNITFPYGSIGIGTTSPETRFVVADGAGYRLAMRQWSGIGMEINAWNDSYQPTIPLRLTANYLSFNTGSPNTERMRITSAGNVGVNTQSPVHLLTLNQPTGGTVLAFTNTFNTPNNRNWSLSSNYLAYGDFSINQSNAKDGDPFAAGTSRIYIQPNGRININTQSDAGFQLDVNGTFRAQGSGFVGTFQGTDPVVSWKNASYEYYAGIIDANNRFRIVDRTANVERISLLSSGNVGIGTSNPNTLLELSGAAPDIRLNRTAGGATTIDFRLNGNQAGYISSNSSTGEQRYYMGPASGWGGFHTFYTDNVERMRITSGGNVGINAQNPLTRLHITSGDSYIASFNTSVTTQTTSFLGLGNFSSYQPGTAGVSIAAHVNLGASFASEFGVFTHTGSAMTEKLRITSLGNVGIGTITPAASARLDVTSTTQGFLPPRMTATQRAAITSPAVGLVVYQTDGNEGLWIYTNANGWKSLAIVV